LLCLLVNNGCSSQSRIINPFNTTNRLLDVHSFTSIHSQIVPFAAFMWFSSSITRNSFYGRRLGQSKRTHTPQHNTTPAHTAAPKLATPKTSHKPFTRKAYYCFAICVFFVQSCTFLLHGYFTVPHKIVRDTSMQ
jgi:hypothetical protein